MAYDVPFTNTLQIHAHFPLTNVELSIRVMKTCSIFQNKVEIYCSTLLSIKLGITIYYLQKIIWVIFIDLIWNPIANDWFLQVWKWGKEMEMVTKLHQAI